MATSNEVRDKTARTDRRQSRVSSFFDRLFEFELWFRSPTAIQSRKISRTLGTRACLLTCVCVQKASTVSQSQSSGQNQEIESKQEEERRGNQPHTLKLNVCCLSCCCRSCDLQLSIFKISFCHSF